MLIMMIPVMLSLGLINFNLLINSFFGSLVSDEAPAGNRQGLPDLSAAAGHLLGGDCDGPLPDPGPFCQPQGTSTRCGAHWPRACRQIILVLLPASAAILVLSELVIRLVYQRGEFNAAETEVVATALFWFASRCRPTACTCCSAEPSSGSRSPGSRPGLRAPISP